MKRVLYLVFFICLVLARAFGQAQLQVRPGVQTAQGQPRVGGDAISIHGVSIPALTTAGYLHWNGTALEWIPVSGGGGSTVWSALTAPTADLTLNMGSHNTTMTYIFPSGPSLGFRIIGNGPALGTGTPSDMVSFEASDSSNVDPLSVNLGPSGRGFFVKAGTGDLQMQYNSKLIGPVQLKDSTNWNTVLANAPSLATDANGNIIAGTPSGGGGGAPTFPVTSLSGAQNLSPAQFAVGATLVNTTTAATAWTLPSPAPTTNGECIRIVNHSNNTLTINPGAGRTINLSTASYIIWGNAAAGMNSAAATVITDGSNYRLIPNPTRDAIRGVSIPTLAAGYLHYTGTALVWDTPAGGGTGATSWSDLTPPTSNLNLNLGAYSTDFNLVANASGFVTGITMSENSSTAPVSGTILGIYPSHPTVNPFEVSTANGDGFYVDGTSGDINIYGQSKLVGPVQLIHNQLPVISAPSLATDASGNIVAGTGAPTFAAGRFLVGDTATPTVPNGGIPCMTNTGPGASGALGTGILNGGGPGGCPVTVTTQAVNQGLILSFNTSAADTYIRGTADTSAGARTGFFVIRQGDQTTTVANVPQSVMGPMMIRAGNNSAPVTVDNAVTRAGTLALFAGAGFPGGAANGFLQEGAPFYGTPGTSTQWHLQCQAGAEQAVANCSATPAYVLGVAQAITATSVAVIYGGEVPISCPGGCTLGHTVCAGSTASVVTDSGGTGVCTTGFLLGVVNRTSGDYNLPNNAANGLGSGPDINVPVALSATLPSVVIISRK